MITIVEPIGAYHMGEPSVVHTSAPVRVYDAAAADPNWKPRPAGFTADLTAEREPLTWDGDNA